MFTPIIGLEIHLQLKTKSKVFCSCSTEEAEPNTNICPICLGYPGSMPNLNKEALIQAIRMGIALNCHIAKETNWDRKSYMYPDLFKGYQISQLDQPVCGEGEIEVLVRNRRNFYSKDNYSKKVGIIRAHLEEDTAKSTHEGEKTLLDGNKAGIPLLEIVSAPDMHTVDEAVSYAKTIRNLARWFGICDGNLELGQMRFDANVSICIDDIDIASKRFDEWKGAKHTPIVEIKNLNSFSNLQDALDYEINRQIKEYEKTKEAYQTGLKETRGWNDQKKITFTQRKKEEANEYRFIPEPDIPTVEIATDELHDIKTALVASPMEARDILLKNGVSTQVADLLAEDRAFFEMYKELTQNREIDYARAANLITNELSGEISIMLSNKNLVSQLSSGRQSNNQETWLDSLALVLKAEKAGEITSTQLKGIIAKHVSTQNDWQGLLNEFKDTSSLLDIQAILQKAFTENPNVVEQIKSGKDSAKMFFIGIVMRETKGKANPNEVKTLIDKLIK